jgi:hypothetical protein
LATPTPTASGEEETTPVAEKTPAKDMGQSTAPTETPDPQEEAESPVSQAGPVTASSLPFGLLSHPTFFAVLDGMYAIGFSGDTNSQLGGDLRMEIQWFSWMSLGIYYDFTMITETGKTPFIGSLGMMGRLFPPDTGRLVPFVTGGLGLNSLSSVNLPQYPGHYHGFAGVGLQCSFTDHWGLDLGCLYNYYSPQIDPLQSIAIRAGLSYDIGL